jgi:hypothetical protein
VLFAANIGIGGDLVAFFFYRLSPQLQRRVKLLTLGSVASFVTLCGVYFGYESARLSFIGGYTLALTLLCIGAITALGSGLL